MKQRILMGLALSASLAAWGCNGDETGNPFDSGTVLDAGSQDATMGGGDGSTGDATTTDGATDGGTTDGGGDGGMPAPPTLGAQIDRMGRPGVNTALVDPFDTNATREDMRKDAYNLAGPDTWSTFTATIAANLAIFDALDGTCGNQLLAGPTATAGRYGTLAAVVSDDRLYLNTASSTCATYLGVEANAVGTRNQDCGGRAPQYDVIDVTYSVLATGTSTGASDGVANDNTFGTTFPYLTEPNSAQ